MGLKGIWYDMFTLFHVNVGLSDILDIAVVAFLVYELIRLINQTHTAQIAKGILVLIFTFVVAKICGFRTLQWLINSVMSFGLIAVVIVFQPELRRALEQVGRRCV